MTSEVMDDYLVKHDANCLSMQGTLRILLLLHATQNDTESVLRLIKVGNSCLKVCVASIKAYLLKRETGIIYTVSQDIFHFDR